MYSSIRGNKNSEPHHRMFCYKLGPGSPGISQFLLIYAAAVEALPCPRWGLACREEGRRWFRGISCFPSLSQDPGLS